MPRIVSVVNTDAAKRAAGSTALSIEATARLVGHYQWIEMRLFEVMGGWVQTVDNLEVKHLLATQSQHHAWHAELWHQQLPDLRELAPEQLVVPPNDRLTTFVEALAEPGGADGATETLVGIYRVLVPRLVAAYSRHLEAASALTDGPTIRVLELVLRDEMDDWREGEILLQSLLLSSETVRSAAERQARLEILLVAAGGVT